MDIADLLNDEPGLTPEIPQAFEKAYRKARLLAAREIGMEEATFPKQSPYTIEQTMADDYLPEGPQSGPPRAPGPAPDRPRPRQSIAARIAATSGCPSRTNSRSR